MARVKLDEDLLSWFLSGQEAETSKEPPAPIKEKSGVEETKDAKPSPNIFSLQAADERTPSKEADEIISFAKIERITITATKHEDESITIKLTGGTDAAREKLQGMLDNSACERQLRGLLFSRAAAWVLGLTRELNRDEAKEIFNRYGMVFNAPR